MAVWKCSKCGFTKESRCKPRKCPECGASGAFEKAEGGSSGGSRKKGKSCRT